MLEFKVNLPDSKLLEDLVESEKLSEEEESAFSRMLDDLRNFLGTLGPKKLRPPGR